MEPLALDDQLCFSLYSTAIAVNRTYKPMLDALGITYPQYLVLNTLWEKDGRGISEIAHRLALEPSTITPLMKRLEAAGFVTRQRDAQDERQVQVHLTPRGQALRAESTCLTETLLKRSGMSLPQIVALNAQLRALRAALAEG
ncbi:MarR family winged helix-turn-helix transcriptional regulator [Roseococcus sp.]|uniref:MarR family winged helix-turn-helix transcriptional regulator n=1 Tax=Roseococcus sp. TaxID=2109646 RepID=UPI003BA90637